MITNHVCVRTNVWRIQARLVYFFNEINGAINEVFLLSQESSWQWMYTHVWLSMLLVEVYFKA